MSRGGNEVKVAMTELVSELDRTRKEFAKAAMQVTQLESQLQSARDDLIRKEQQIHGLEQELQSRDERQRQLLNTMEEEYKSKEVAWVHRIKTMDMEVARLQAENAAMIMMERENRQLRDTILENQAVMERLQTINDDLRNKAKDDARDQSAFLEAEFKRRLAESEKKFRAEAYRALSEEAKLALQGNDHLQTVLQRQNDSIEAVLLRCKTLETAHAKIQMEQEENLQSIQTHVAEVQRLKKQLAESKSKGALMDEALKQRRVERASLELLFVEYETTRKQLGQVKEKYRRSMREAERWKNRAVQLTHELDDEQREAAEAKLATMQAQSDNIEEHLEKKRQRDAKHAKVRASHAERANALRQVEGGSQNSPWSDDGGSDAAAAWEGISDEEDDARLPGGGRHRAIDPMEILAMWNVNFDSWRPRDDHTAAVQATSAVPLRNATGDTPNVEPTPETADLLHHGGRKSSSDVLRSGPDAVVSTGSVPPPPVAAEGSYTHESGGRREAKPLLNSSERQALMDARMSVLSQPKNSAVPPGARYYAKGGRKPLELQRQPMPPLQELNTVSHGEFKVAKRTGGGGPDSRFLVP